MIGPRETYVKVLVCHDCDCVIRKDLEKTRLFNARVVRYCKHEGLKAAGGGEVACLLGWPRTPPWCPAKEGNGLLKGKDWPWYLEALKGDVCACGEAKEPTKSFCGRCYTALPVRLEQRLSDYIGVGYEQAYEESVIYLKNNVWKKVGEQGGDR